MADEAQDDTSPSSSETKLHEVHARALRRFDAASIPQQEIRAHALLCRRFIAVPGAMWEGEWGEQFENAVRLEIDKISKDAEKIERDYRNNRIVPDFRPSGENSDQETADTLDGLHRADSYHFKAQQGRDNAFSEALHGGFGAYRLCNDYADESDPDNDEQRINPGLLIADADQRVFFDPNSKLYDKSDARFCFVLTADSRDAFEEEYPDKDSDWPENRLEVQFDWFRPDTVVKAEYYEVESKREKLLIFTLPTTGEEQRVWKSELDDTDQQDMEAQGWKLVDTQTRQRRRVHKYVMSGAEVLEDCGFIAGDQIPVVPMYGRRYFVDGVERFRGLVSKRMDAQRLYNVKVSKAAEIDALAPREKPIFDPEQIQGFEEMWANQEIERHPYALAKALRNPDGSIAALGPIGTITPPQLPPVTAMLLQIAKADLEEGDADGTDDLVANTSAAAMDIANTRNDDKSGIYLDNNRQTVQREGEIYLSMAKDVYWEPGRTVDTMSEDGDDGQAKLMEQVTDKDGTPRIRNDFTTGKYKVIADVTEATATRRDKTVKSMLATADLAVNAQDIELAQAAVLTAVMNQDGEGMTDMQKYARKRLVGMGVVEPNEEEQKELEAQSQNQQPDPQSNAFNAQAEALHAAAAKDMALREKTLADTEQSKAKTAQILDSIHHAHADTHLKTAQGLSGIANDHAETMHGIADMHANSEHNRTLSHAKTFHGIADQQAKTQHQFQQAAKPAAPPKL